MPDKTPSTTTASSSLFTYLVTYGWWDGETYDEIEQALQQALRFKDLWALVLQCDLACERR